MNRTRTSEIDHICRHIDEYTIHNAPIVSPKPGNRFIIKISDCGHFKHRLGKLIQG